ncbi:iron-containing alcohol dehydrogenase [Breznakiella homolactica]|uniref:Iron-containing alcohol dehydrogenase n=1 Tax=Breznakiella homolactica TaxID=2798577 RepID=A0A7T7XLE6_9SPIR|nr:iron-containing alcohol dehydrogenase [Breznakiella homolactica]QQO08362.1 iron-containing alcohol dehydrogenase [Breznakiella homolactica]
MKFTHCGNSRLEFGPGAVSRLPEIIRENAGGAGVTAEHLVLVTGGASFDRIPQLGKFTAALREKGFKILHFRCSGEPSPEFVDTAVRDVFASWGQEMAIRNEIAVVGIGGGSALDAGKAIAAMLPAAARDIPAPSVADFLEGVGTRKPDGSTALFIACPTTAGTGSEATKNAVISRVGEEGFKKSLRHDRYLPAAAVVDPELALSCPRDITAASGLDALTQLLEAWTSPLVTPVISDLCAGAVQAFGRGYERVLQDGNDIEARADLAYAAYVSGLALANAGLGSVHALASVVGGRFPVPHGTICGRLIGAGARLNIERLARGLGSGKLSAGDRRNYEQAYAAYARAGYLLNGDSNSCFYGTGGIEFERGAGLLLERIRGFTELARLPPWTAFGFDVLEIPRLAALAAAKSNPVPLKTADYEALLREGADA